MRHYMARRSTEYINNRDFQNALLKRKESVDYAKLNGLPIPELDKYLCESILHICRRLIYRPNFINYTYKEEMIGDAIFCCITNVDKYKCEFDNPFAYFTQCAWNAYVAVIKREKKQTKTKAAIFQSVSTEFLDIQEHDSDENFSNGYVDFMKTNVYMEYDLGNSSTKKKKDKKKTIEELV